MGFIMNTITANELKVRGVATISEHLAGQAEAIITVHGEKKYVVMDVAHYQYLRECELEAALHEAKADLAAGDTITESVDAHIKRITDGI